jgi:DNA replication ATP-dependent helicase Dna2
MRFPGTGLTSSIYRATTASAAQSHDMEDLFRQLPPLSFRLDKDDVTVGITTLRSFLARLFVGSRPSTGGEGHSLGNEKCRRLIIDLEEPRFSVQKELFPTSPAGKMLEQEFYESLNSDQRSAIRLALAAQDYALLLGMPGTGKTATICFLVRLVVSRGGTVLIASYTHSAVDNILMRLLQAGVHCLRLASTLDSVHPGVREACLLQKTAVMTTTADYARELLSAPVVGTTCLGVRNSLCERREFDLCLVDEAGQITIPAVLGSISCARTFILVGDHFQLPPLVLSKEATTAGLGVSLLRRLCEAHPAASVQLSIQYRMNSDITELCNTLVYGNRLRCANAAVAGQSVQLDMDAISSHDRHIPDWLASILSPKVSIALLNTDSMVQGDATFSAAESSRAAQKGRGGITNTVEVTLTDIILWCLLHLGGMDSQQVGVISPYRSQVALLQTQLLSRPWAKDIEVNTIDKFQGRDKVRKITILVYTRGGPASHTYHH